MRFGTYLLAFAASLFSLSVQTYGRQAQFCNATAYSEAEPYPTLDSVINQPFATVNDYQGNPYTLSLDIYAPKRTGNASVRRPLILLMHAGSFTGGKKEGLDDECRLFAKRGFVAATLDYRLGFAATGCDDFSVQQQARAVYRAIQDADTALRFLVSKATMYRIDTSWIFVGGQSAGTFIADNLTFTSQSEFESAYVPGTTSGLGPLRRPGRKYKIKGLFQNWGCVLKKNFISATEAVPMIALHGQNDRTAPLDSAVSNAQYCTLGPVIYGSQAIYNKVTGYGKCAQLYVLPAGGHGVWQDKPNTLKRINLAACFFRSVMCSAPACSTLQSLNANLPVASCSSASSRVGLEDEGGLGLEPMSVYPNPATASIAIQGLEADAAYTISVYNAVGQRVATSENTNQLPTAHLPAGLYTVRVVQAGVATHLRFVKE